MKKLFWLVPLGIVFLTACTMFAAKPTPTHVATPSAAAVSVTKAPNCSDSAAFVSDVSIPDFTNFKQGAAFTKTWRVKNTGTCTWTNEYTLVFLAGTRMSKPDPISLSLTKPGDTLDISTNLTAPGQDNVYRSDFEIHNPGRTAIPIDKSTNLWVIITVGSGSASSGSGTGAGSGAGTGTGSGAASGAGLLTSVCAFTIDPIRVNDVITAINAYRKDAGLPAYSVNAQLTGAAQSHSNDMACNNLFVHVGSDGSNPAQRIASAGFSASAATENVYGSFPPLTGAGAVGWWKADLTDPNHNLNLISTQYTSIGVGYSFFNNYGYFVVDFASP
jgi:hypothetical protein